MKTASTLAAAAALIVQSALALDKCNYAVVAPQLHSLGDEITACHAATGYYLAPPPAPPTAAQQQGICSKCQSFITKVEPMVWPECTLNLAGTDQTLMAFFKSVTSPCDVALAPVTAVPTTNPVVKPPAGGATSPTTGNTSTPTTTPTLAPTQPTPGTTTPAVTQPATSC